MTVVTRKKSRSENIIFGYHGMAQSSSIVSSASLPSPPAALLRFGSGSRSADGVDDTFVVVLLDDSEEAEVVVVVPKVGIGYY